MTVHYLHMDHLTYTVIKHISTCIMCIHCMCVIIHVCTVYSSCLVFIPANIPVSIKYGHTHKVLTSVHPMVSNSIVNDSCSPTAANLEAQ